MPPLEPWYVTGLAEVAGVFTYSRSGDTLNLVFAIRRPAGEEALLDDLQAFFGGAGRRYGRQLRITRLGELAAVVSHFDEYPLQGRSGEVYMIWREMARLKRGAFRKPPVRRLEELAVELSATRGHTKERSGRPLAGPE